MKPDQDRLPSKPLRNWLLAWHIHTGDPADVIAKGFDLPREQVTELLSGSGPLMLSIDEAMDICKRLRIDPRTRWTGLRSQPPWLSIATASAFTNLVELLDKSPIPR